MKLFVKDNTTGKVHEVGTNVHDSLWLNDDGSIHYYNMQIGEGTYANGFSFCDENGNVPSFDDIDFIETGQRWLPIIK